MNFVLPRRTVSIVLALAATATFFAPLQAQTHTEPEPVLDALRAAFNQEGLRLGMLLQTVLDPAIDNSDAAEPSVQIAAMRLRLTGDLDGGFNYAFQTNFVGTPSILDARLGWDASDEFGIWAGRFKTPFSRELLTYAGSIDLVNRSRVVDALAPGRQMGIQLHGQAGPGTSWSLGGFTGPDNSPANESIIGVARFEVSPQLDQDDVDLSFAASAAIGRDGAIAGGTIGQGFQGDGTIFGIDGRMTSGRLLVAGEAIIGDFDPVAAASMDAAGLYLTAGWMTAATQQVLVRWDRYRGIGASSDDAIVFGFNAWPTTASEIQINWIAPIAGSTMPHKILVNFQLGF